MRLLKAYEALKRLMGRRSPSKAVRYQRHLKGLLKGFEKAFSKSLRDLLKAFEMVFTSLERPIRG